MTEHLDVHGLVKPLLRGRLHVAAFLAAVPAAIVLVGLARSATAAVAAGVYGLTLVGLFGVSGAYHRLGHTPRSQAWLRRADHATIYFLIAGSYTPVALVAVGGALGWAMVAAVWTAALVGGALKLVWFDRSRILGAALYLALGWAAVAATPTLAARLEVPALALLLGGGLVYTAGALVLGWRWPDPHPRIFGYHEVWHSMTIVAAGLHYVAILRIVS